MGFRLSSFLGGMAEGAIEIEENVRKRNEKLIDTNLTLSAERTAKAIEERKKVQETYDMLAKQLSSFEGMDDNKVNVVLSYGPEVAKSFLETAPKKAAREGLGVSDYVVLLETGEGTLPETSTTELIQYGTSLPGLSAIEESEKPKLAKGIFQRDYTDQYESTKESVYGGLGIEIPETREDVAVPEGRISFMDLLSGGDGAEGLKITRAGMNKSVAERLVPLSDAAIEIRDDGSLVYDKDQQAVAAAINDIQTRTVETFNRLIGANPARATANPEAYYQVALDTVLQNLPQAQANLFPKLFTPQPQGGGSGAGAGSQGGGGGAGSGGASNQSVKQQIQTIQNNASLTPAVQKAQSRAVLIRSGLATTPQEADQLLQSGNY